MKLIIDRKKWGRGDSGGRLLNDNKKMCCLGFLGLKCGLTPNRIRGLSMPTDVKGAVKRNKTVWAAMFDEDANNSVLANAFANTNDSRLTSDKQKEAVITRKFKKIGVDVKFKN